MFVLTWRYSGHSELTAIPFTLPQATYQVIRGHAREGLTDLTWREGAHHCTSLLMSQPLALPSIHLNVNQLGRHKGLTLCLRVIIMCIFFRSNWSIGSHPQRCFWGELSSLVRDWPVGIIKRKPRLGGGFVGRWRGWGRGAFWRSQAFLF